ncbi:SusC/RagA family TonB-linked outer membrane protein [Xanthomarina sp.]|uniref:SusC/RagA family TonB-linked outer membrane protein n=1 Tax=Xanthomarina sp. TaxID=1931211 RepID=UPI002BA83601|nr:SusC/RagA family TonB-linked outer membrane protein [Xanthomarina sp.]HLV38548.1 SusC/RagA family TonB-linked outer membrane protein [Xanthomarina sp.]
MFFIFYFSADAQQIQVSGQITDGQTAISGASILVKNTVQGTVSDFDGRFELYAEKTDTLLISYLGYKPMELAVGNRRTIAVVLQEDATALGEVTINAGYYNTTERAKTGSIARMTTKEIETQPVTNPLAAMEGRMTGVDIVQTSGVPGSGFEVRIRGQNSIMAGNAPLYIVDGVPFNEQTLGSRNSSGTIIPGGNISPLNAINPSFIESIEVLKDADATAIYGSRGANGVVLITTKKGQQSKTKFTINSSTGIANITQKRDLMNTEQYLDMRREAFENDGITAYPANAYDVNGTWDPNRYTDWQEELIGGTASTRQFMASVSGGSENTQFLLSGMYQNETTVFPGDFNYDRITFNSNIRHSSTDKKIQLDFSAGYTVEDNLLPGKDLTSDAYRLSPNAPNLYNDDGSLNWENSTWTNPLAQLEGKYTNQSNNLIANTVVSYNLFENFQVKLSAGYTNTKLEDHRIIPHTIYNPAYGLDSSVSQSYSHSGNRHSFIVEPQLNWTRKGEKHTWNFLLGATFQSQEQDMLTLLGIGYANNSFLGNLNAAKNLIILNETEQEYNYQSVFARINYAYKNKIFINATGRRDGSSRFGPGNRFGNFGAIGVAWLFSEELKLPWLNLGKLRGSYGLTGNDQIGDYQYLQTYIIGDYPYDGNIGLVPARLYNPNFKWEENVKKEVAMELGFFEQGLSLSVAYYNNRSTNQLINYALPGTTGFNSIQANLDAKVENSGWEFELSGAVFRSTNFKLNTSINLSLPQNKLLEFPGLEDSSYANQYVIGKPLSIFKLYHLQGVNPDTGLFEVEDYNGDGLITSAEDKQYVADLNPKFYGGISNSLSYKNWGLDFLFQFVKQKGFNEFYGSQPPGTMFNQPVSVLEHWQVPGDQTMMQQYTAGANPSATLAYSQFTQSNGIISDASFIRLKTLALSYSLFFGQGGDSSCRISLQGQNLLTFTKFNGGDPEQITGFLPPLRRISLGVQFDL